MDIQKIQTQIDLLQRCVDNLKSAKGIVETLEKHPNNPSYAKRINFANDQAARCEQTLIGQLKLVNIQNYELLK